MEKMTRILYEGLVKLRKVECFNNLPFVAKIPCQSHFIIASDVFNLEPNFDMVYKAERKDINLQTKHPVQGML